MTKYVEIKYTGTLNIDLSKILSPEQLEKVVQAEVRWDDLGIYLSDGQYLDFSLEMLGAVDSIDLIDWKHPDTDIIETDDTVVSYPQSN